MVLPSAGFKISSQSFEAPKGGLEAVIGTDATGILQNNRGLAPMADCRAAAAADWLQFFLIDGISLRDQGLSGSAVSRRGL